MSIATRTSVLTPRGRSRRRPDRSGSTSFTVNEPAISHDDHPESDVDYMATGSDFLQEEMVPVWLPEVWEQLQAIAALPDDWDSYGGLTPDTEKLEAAWSLLICLCQNTDLPKPYVNPTRNGSVQFEWEVGGRYFEIEVEAVAAATYLYCDDITHVEETGYIFQEENPLEPVREYIRKVALLS